MITVLIIAYLVMGLIVGTIVVINEGDEDSMILTCVMMFASTLWPTIVMLWLMSEWVNFIKGFKK